MYLYGLSACSTAKCWWLFNNWLVGTLLGLCQLYQENLSQPCSASQAQEFLANRIIDVAFESRHHRLGWGSKMAAAASSLGEQIREELTCSICLELFTRPKVLPCMHTFCQDCLQVHVRKEGMSECPNCRQQVTLPSEGVTGLPDNSIVANMCERFKQQATLSTGEQPQPGKKCSIHPSEEVKLYCKQCQSPVCELCLEEAHDGHATTTIKKAAQEKSSTVQALINEGRNILDGYHSFTRGLEETETALSKKKYETDNGIIQAYNQMVQKLTERKDHLLSEAEQDHKKNLKKIQNGKDGVSADVSELSAACDRAEQELQKEGVELVGQRTTLPEVVGKYRGKAAPTPVQTQPAVFQPSDTPVPVLGHVKAGDTGHHQGNQKQEEPQPEKVTFGGRGGELGKFKDPVGVAISDEGEIFVADRGNQRIQIFNVQGKYVKQFSTAKMSPQDVALDGKGNLWVVEWTESKEFAVKYNTCKNGVQLGKMQRTIELQAMGRGIAVDTRRNHILVTQTTGDGQTLHGEVQVFRPDGTLVRTVGQQQEMKEPWSIAVDRDGRILVSDRGKNRVYVYNEHGQFLLQLGDGRGSGTLYGPRGICTDRAGNVIVADTDNCHLKIFYKMGYFLKDITNDMQQPWAVAKATQGPLVVTDGMTDTVTVLLKT